MKSSTCLRKVISGYSALPLSQPYLNYGRDHVNGDTTAIQTNTTNVMNSVYTHFEVLKFKKVCINIVCVCSQKVKYIYKEIPEKYNKMLQETFLNFNLCSTLLVYFCHRTSDTMQIFHQSLSRYFMTISFPLFHGLLHDTKNTPNV